jgi:hypothetical protein
MTAKKTPAKKTRTGAREGSATAYLATFTVGECRYVHTSPERSVTDMHKFNPHKPTRPAEIAKMEFATRFITGIPAKPIGDVIFLLEVKRTK